MLCSRNYLKLFAPFQMQISIKKIIIYMGLKNRQTSPGGRMQKRNGCGVQLADVPE